MPCIMQCFIGRPGDVNAGADFDRRLYVIRREFEQINKGLGRTDFKAQSASGLGAPLSTFANYFSSLLIYFAGAYMAMDGDFTFGQLTAFVAFNSIMATPINRMASSIQGLSNMSAALKRIFGLMERGFHHPGTKI